MRMVAPGRSRGFTLIEVMLALAILGMIVAAIYSSWMAIVRGAETGKKAAAEVQRSRIAVQTLAETLKCARSFEANRKYYSFEAKNGSDAMLSFVSYIPDSSYLSGRIGALNMPGLTVRRLTFSLEQGDDFGKELVLRQWPVLMEMGADERERPLVLLKNVKEFEMEFWDDKKDKGEWVDEWTETNRLPWKVIIRLKWGAGNAQAFQSSQADQGITNLVELKAGTVKSMWQTQTRPGTAVIP